MIASKNRIFFILSLLIAEVYYSNSTTDCPNKNINCTKNVSHGNLLIFTTPTKIKMLNLITMDLSVLRTKTECATLTAENDFVYYTNFRDGSKFIYKTSIISKMTSNVLSWNTPITSVAIDYITNNIYFSTETSILVCKREDRRSCKHVVCYEGRYVALAPRSGIMFYTRRAPRGDKRYYVLKSNMDGSEEDVVIDGTFSDPAFLTVDESNETLHWVERGTNKTHSIPYNRNDSKMESYEIKGDYPIGPITVFRNMILFAKNESYIIDSLDAISRERSMFYSDLAALTIDLLRAYNPVERKIHKMDNPCETTPCPKDDICVLKSSTNSKKVECSCLNQVYLVTCG